MITANPQQVGDTAVELLIEAGAVLASSLDLPTTLRQVARLTVPRLADLCVIDMRAEDGSIRGVAVAARDERMAKRIEQVRIRHPLDAGSDHPVARVIDSGRPLLLSRINGARLGSFAPETEPARFMLDHHYRSMVVAPLLARQRTLGAISTLRHRDGACYDSDDVEIVCELARRAALALDNARLFGDLQRVEQRLEAILENLAEAITVLDAHGQLIFANQAAADLVEAATPGELTEAPPEEMLRAFLILDEHGREIEIDRLLHRRLARGRQAEPLLVRAVRRADGRERWLNIRSSTVSDPRSGHMLYAVDVFEDITEVMRAQLAESFMAEASSVLATCTDHCEALQRLTELAVPQIADWCAVDLLDDSGQLEQVAAHHVEPDRLKLARRLMCAYPTQPHGHGGITEEVISSGASRLYSDIASQPPGGAHGQRLLAVGASEAIVVPLAGAARTIGAVTLGSCRSGRRLSSADLALAERLGRHVGTAVENARLYAERARIAHTLQQALLPQSLPQIPGADIQALYSAAGELNEVGGDFYDVFPYSEQRWLLVIGDICGKGPRAAAVTALARHTLRTAAMSGQSPIEMVHTLHRALREQPSGGDLCTVCLATVAPRGGQARIGITLAGHPQPLVIDPAGEARAAGRPGTLLGMVEPLRLSESESLLSSGQTLLLYTDGVSEAGQADRRLGEHGLKRLCGEASTRPLAELLSAIQRSAREHADGHLRDDIALLALRMTGEAPLCR